MTDDGMPVPGPLDGPPEIDTEALRATLVDAGVPVDEVERASREGTLVFLAIEHFALGDPLEYDLDGLSAATGLPAEYISSLWRSLGFPQPRPGERIFTSADVEMLSTVAELMDRGVIPPDLAMQMSRVIGSSMARVASAQLDAFEPVEDDEAGEGPDRDVLTFAPELMPTMPRIMEYVWRRHLQGEARQRVVRQSGGGPDELVVGFADLVGFTAMSQQLPPRALAGVVDRFETIAYDTVGRLEGRVVKMIGDEVMFATTDATAAVEIGLRLAEAYSDDNELSEVRVGIAAGEVLQREADLFGPVVNLASRIVNLAFPGSVVVSESVEETIAGDESYVRRPIGRRHLKGIGRLPLWVVRRAQPALPLASADDAPDGSRVDRRERVVDRLAAQAQR